MREDRSTNGFYTWEYEPLINLLKFVISFFAK